jgi:putative exosortase-associated protein (TIGR04073 family)
MRRLPIVLVCLMIAAWAIAIPAPALASSEHKNIEGTTPQELVDAMATKGVRGGINALTGWVELPKQIYVTTKESGWGKGLLVGPFKGIGMTLVRTLSGLGEVATFYLAYPGFYDPWFEPHFVWQPDP